MKSCEQYELLASLVLDGEASPEEQAELQEHLDACPACRAYFADIRRIHEAFVPEEIVVPEGFAARVMDRVRTAEQEQPVEKPKKTIQFPRWRQWAALAACCGVIMLNAWAAYGVKGARYKMVSADAAAPASENMQIQTAPSAAQKPAGRIEDRTSVSKDEAYDDTVMALDDALPVIPEEHAESAKAAAREGAGEGEYQPLADTETGPELESASMPAEFAAGGGDADVLPAAEIPDSDDAEPDAIATEEETDQLENADLPAELPAPALAADLPEDGVEPVEVIGVPESGILIVYGGAAQAWVEDVLGLEWAEGGSYPLTAEQYGGLLRILDEAGEPFRIEPGEGYCLMTE